MTEDVAAEIGSNLSLTLLIKLSNYYFSLIILSFELFISLILYPLNYHIPEDVAAEMAEHAK